MLTQTLLAWIFGVIEGKLIEILQPSRIPNFAFQRGTFGLQPVHGINPAFSSAMHVV